mgnify:CR=1 FL=1
MPGLYRDAAFREGYAQLALHGLSFDAYRFDTLDYLYEIAAPVSIAEAA